MKEHKAIQVLPAQATLGEGPIWDGRHNVYWWIDIVERTLFRFDPALGQNDSWQLDAMPGTVVARKSGGLLLSTENGFESFDPSSGSQTPICDPEPHLPENRFNDGKCDPAGRFWAETMHHDDHMEKHTGSLYSLDKNHNITTRLTGIGVSNGIVWTKNATKMYYVDSPTRNIVGFDYDVATGDITNPFPIFTATEEMGFPDGMAIDEDDNLWVAFWGGWSVAKICPTTGSLLAKIALPCSNVTACAFGGPKMSQLLITTASVGLDRDSRQSQPMAGDLFAVDLDVRGPQPSEFLG